MRGDGEPPPRRSNGPNTHVPMPRTAMAIDRTLLVPSLIGANLGRCPGKIICEAIQGFPGQLPHLPEGPLGGRQAGDRVLVNMIHQDPINGVLLRALSLLVGAGYLPAADRIPIEAVRDILCDLNRLPRELQLGPLARGGPPVRPAMAQLKERRSAENNPPPFAGAPGLLKPYRDRVLVGRSQSGCNGDLADPRNQPTDAAVASR